MRVVLEKLKLCFACVSHTEALLAFIQVNASSLPLFEHHTLTVGHFLYVFIAALSSYLTANNVSSRLFSSLPVSSSELIGVL